MWSRVATSSATWIGWLKGNSATARPMRIRRVRAAMALATIRGEDRTLIGAKWYSANHTESTPPASASSTSEKHSAKASGSLIPSRQGNSTNNPMSMHALLSHPRLRTLETLGYLLDCDGTGMCASVKRQCSGLTNRKKDPHNVSLSHVHFLANLMRTKHQIRIACV